MFGYTVKPVYNDHNNGIFFSQKAAIVGKSKLTPSVFIKTYYWINHS